MTPGSPSEHKRGFGSEELRRAFDASFALPARAAGEELEDLMTIRVCSDDYALRGRELSGFRRFAGFRCLEHPNCLVSSPCRRARAGFRLSLCSVRSDRSPCAVGDGGHDEPSRLRCTRHRVERLSEAFSCDGFSGAGTST